MSCAGSSGKSAAIKTSYNPIPEENGIGYDDEVARKAKLMRDRVNKKLKGKLPVDEIGNLGKLRPGDHIFWRDRDNKANHHAIVEAVFYDREPSAGNVEGLDKDKFNITLIDLLTSGVRRKRAFNLSGKTNCVSRVVYDEGARLPTSTVIERAQDQMHASHFNIALYNCEHFAFWCTQGVMWSSQVNRAAEIFAKAGKKMKETSSPDQVAKAGKKTKEAISPDQVVFTKV